MGSDRVFEARFEAEANYGKVCQELRLLKEEGEAKSKKLAAGIFGLFFKELARNPTEECREVARAAWPQRFQFDFADEAMGADGALVTLGLAEEAETVVDGEKVTGVRYL